MIFFSNFPHAPVVYSGESFGPFESDTRVSNPGGSTTILSSQLVSKVNSGIYGTDASGLRSLSNRSFSSDMASGPLS